MTDDDPTAVAPHVKLLALDCSTDACSVALWLDGTCTYEHVVAPRQHASLVLEMVERLLAGAEIALGRLDGLALGHGPGSFTGVRIAASVAQGLALGAGLGVATVSSLAALACSARRVTGHGRVAAALDARMGEIYWGVYAFAGDAGEPTPAGTQLTADCLCKPADAPLPAAPAGDWLGAGPGWDVHGPALQARIRGANLTLRPDLHPHAMEIAHLGAAAFARGEAVDAACALPVYLRNRVAERPRRMHIAPGGRV